MTEPPPADRRRPSAPASSSGQSLPRRLVTLWLPLVLLRGRAAVPVLLDGGHRPEVERGALQLQGLQPALGPFADAGQHQQAPVRDRLSALADGRPWAWPSPRPSSPSFASRARRLRHPAPALPGQQLAGPRHLPRLPGPALDPVHPAGDHGLQPRPLRQPAGADPDLPHLPDPVLHLAPDRLLQVDPLRARGMRADRRRHRACRSCGRSPCRSPSPA